MNFSFLGYVGRKTIRFTTHLLNHLAFGYRITRIFLTPGIGIKTHHRRIILEQVYFSCVKALPLISFVALIMGTMMIIYFSKVSETYSLGRLAVLLIIREIGPVVTALLIILRSATPLTIEVHGMCAGNRFQTLKTAGLDPIKEVCFPRIVGVLASVLCLFIVFDLTAIFGGAATVWIVSSIPIVGFLTQLGKAVMLTDIVVGVVKALCFGVIVSITCMFHGLRLTYQTEPIPMMAPQAAIYCFIYCMIADIFISFTFYW
ncbi:MAG: ABC transporter permease [Thermodesulfobacteriota bacterium]